MTLKTDVRLVAATNRRLDEDVRAGRFRQDLWYRLNVFPITVPPLRQRPEDIPLLVTVFIEKHCRKQGKPVLQVSKAAMKALQGREWAGNVRELENVVERAVISSPGPMFEIGDDPETTVSLSPAGSHGAEDRRTLAQAERDLMRGDPRATLLAHRGGRRRRRRAWDQREHAAEPHAKARDSSARAPAGRDGVAGDAASLAIRPMRPPT